MSESSGSRASSNPTPSVSNGLIEEDYKMKDSYSDEVQRLTEDSTNNLLKENEQTKMNTKEALTDPDEGTIASPLRIVKKINPAS